MSLLIPFWGLIIWGGGTLFIVTRPHKVRLQQNIVRIGPAGLPDLVKPTSPLIS